MGKRILIMAGGTGGHVFPALAVARLLREQGWQVSWLGTKKGMESRIVPENGIDIDWISVSGLRGKGLTAKLKAPLMLLDACRQVAGVLRRHRPDVVLGMGGFVAGPGGLMAKMFRVPLVIHEQNRVPGTTNRLLARLANVVLEAFPGSFNGPVAALCTGNPLREELLNIGQEPRPHSDDNLRVLVVGGSQGAQVLNEVVPEALAQVTSVKVRHQTGKAMLGQVRENYRQLGVEADVEAFIEDMAIMYRWADLIICRAGAMTVSEVAAAGLPAILVPFALAIDDHQTANANYLVDAGAGVMIPQRELGSGMLARQIESTRPKIRAMARAARSCARLDATQAVAEVCITEAGL